MVEFMDEKRVNDSELERLIIIALSVLHQHTIYIGAHHVQMSLLKEHQPGWFHYGILVPQSVDRVIDLDFEFTDKVKNSSFQKNVRDYFKPVFEAIGG